MASKKKKSQKITRNQKILIAIAIIIYVLIAKTVVGSSDPWNVLGTLGVLFVMPLAIVMPIVMLLFWICMFVDLLRTNQYLWSAIMSIFPFSVIFYWLLASSNRPR